MSFWVFSILACSPDADVPPADSGRTESAVHGTDSSPVEPPGDTETKDSSPQDTARPTDEFTFTEGVPKNILMISIDTTQIARLGRYSGEDTTPFLDKTFSESFVLEGHQSCSNWTYASFVCFVGGAYALEQGFVPGASPTIGNQPYPDELTAATEVLAENGYWQAVVSSNKFFSADSLTTPGVQEETLLGGKAWASQVNKAAAPYLEHAAEIEGPWYIHLHYMDPHAPYTVPDEYSTEADALPPIDWDLSSVPDVEELISTWPTLDAETQALLRQHVDAHYRAALRYLDDQLFELVSSATGLGLLEDTMIVIWTDHGEQLGEHGQLGHEVDLYTELTRSVVAFRAPGLKAGAWGGPTTHADIWPTLFELLEIDPGPTFTGVPAGDRPDSDPIYSTKLLDEDQVMLMVEREGLRLHYTFAGEKAFYDLKTDPLESSDLYDAGDERVVELWDLLLPRVKALEALSEEYEAVDPGP